MGCFMSCGRAKGTNAEPAQGSSAGHHQPDYNTPAGNAGYPLHDLAPVGNRLDITPAAQPPAQALAGPRPSRYPTIRAVPQEPDRLLGTSSRNMLGSRISSGPALSHSMSQFLQGEPTEHRPLPATPSRQAARGSVSPAEPGVPGPSTSAHTAVTPVRSPGNNMTPAAQVNINDAPHDESVVSPSLAHSTSQPSALTPGNKIERPRAPTPNESGRQDQEQAMAANNLTPSPSSPNQPGNKSGSAAAALEQQLESTNSHYHPDDNPVPLKSPRLE
ncbi:hypothetical protein QBC46DRAFT_409878 [Diplogelasinospora grovesii]|uniref:Uncharacterized protein n=1 Tax=Diplogelasinospora grovesii TaxID=303347 RepID=A0AAN6S332_9PEZI|nr:hypothetical protein QBC46DRAFT_409878 [Diplogelasinospora grovesii]